jgi:hypothetical protein
VNLTLTMHERKARTTKKVAKRRQKAKVKALRKCEMKQMNTDPVPFISVVKIVVKQRVMDQSVFCATHISR